MPLSSDRPFRLQPHRFIAIAIAIIIVIDGPLIIR
jgi:hypothetical protein